MRAREAMAGAPCPEEERTPLAPKDGTPEPLDVEQNVPAAQSAPSCGGLGCLKATILGSVVLQNTGYALIRRYSRGSLREKYSTSSVLLVMELAKLLLSAFQARARRTARACTHPAGARRPAARGRAGSEARARAQVIHSGEPSDVPAGTAWSKYLHLIQTMGVMTIPAGRHHARVRPRRALTACAPVLSRGAQASISR